MIVLLILVRAGDLTRHITDQLQTIWILSYIGSNQTINLEAFTRGFFGSVFGIIRRSIKQINIDNKIGIVDGGTNFLNNGNFLLICIGIFVFLSLICMGIKYYFKSN